MNSYGTRTNPIAALPTGTSMNPLHPETAEYYNADTTCYVLFKLNENRTRPTRVFTSFGNFSEWIIGSTAHFEHDQTRAYLGEYKVVGIVDFKTGEKAGLVPDLKIKHCVAK